MDISEDNGPQQEIESSDGSTATPPDPQPGVGPAPRDPSLWLIALGALMLLAGAVGIYYLPANLDLLLPLCFWLLLATVLLGLAAWRAISRLSLPVNNTVRYRPNGESITWNRFASLTSLLLATVLVSAIATIGMFGFALDWPSFYSGLDSFSFRSIYWETERPFVLLVTSSAAIILLLFFWLTRIRPLQKLLQLRFAALGILAIPVVIYLALNPWLPTLLDGPEFDSGYTGPFASWPALVQFARHEADRIDKDAIMYDVEFLPFPFHGPYSPQTTVFGVHFMFVRPNGGGIETELVDTNPIRLEYVVSSSESSINTYEYAHERFADWLAYIKLDPRDVYSLTDKEATAFAQRHGINFAEFWPSLRMTLLFDGISSSQDGVPAVWRMSYITETGSASLDLEIDGANGKVLRRDSLPSESTVTPTPLPVATASPSP